MILLFATTDKIQLVTGQAADIDVHASFMDMTQVDPPVPKGSTSGRQNTAAITTATTTDIVAAPAVTTTRNVKSLFIRNVHASQSCDVTVLYNLNGVTIELHKDTLKAGESVQLVDGVPFYPQRLITPGDLIRVLDADATGQNVSTAQPWFPSLGGVNVLADTTYRFQGWLHLTHGVGSHTTGTLMGASPGTATITSIDYVGECVTPATENAIQTAVSTKHCNATANQVLNAASTAASTLIYVEGVVRISAAGTFIPQYQMSVAPGVTVLSKRGSFFKMEKWGVGAFVSQGVWS